MSRVYLDTNFLFGLVRQDERVSDPAFTAWRGRVDAETRADPLVVSALVVDELAYRLVLAWLRDSGDNQPLTTFRQSPATVMKRMRPRLAKLWKALDAIDLDIAASDLLSIRHAQSLMSDPGLTPRDAFHAAYAIDSRCAWIVSSDPEFDRVRRLSRLGPD